MLRPYESYWDGDGENEEKSIIFFKEIENTTFILAAHSANIIVRNQFLDIALGYIEQLIRDERFISFYKRNEQSINSLKLRFKSVMNEDLEKGKNMISIFKKHPILIRGKDSTLVEQI